MNQFLRLSEDHGMFRTVLPPFNNQSWPKIVSPDGFIWITTPFIDFSGQLDSIVCNSLFGICDIDVKCSIHHVDLDVSLPASDFLRVVEGAFPQGLDFIQSGKHQPTGFRLSSISSERWPELMARNQISLVFHRPAGGEPSIVTSCQPDTVTAIIDRFSQNKGGETVD